MRQVKVLGISLLALSLSACFDSDNDDEVAVNNPPSAGALSLTTQTEVALSDNLPGADAENDPIAFFLGDAPSLGQAQVQVDGTFTYQPFAEVTGNDSFSYIVRDAKGREATAVVSITIEALELSYRDYSRQVFAADPTDAPLSVNGRVFIQDVANQGDYQDLIDSN